MAHILIVEDDPAIAASVRRALTYDGHRVDVAPDGRAGLDAARSGQPDLIILDLMLPEVDGLEVCRRIRAAGDTVPILMLTAKATVAERVEGLKTGADDYLPKPFAHEELLARTAALLRRGTVERRERLSLADLSIDVEAMEAWRGDRRIDLTALEFQLLVYFARNPRIVLSRSQILLGVWGLDADTTSNIVDVYVRYLRQKLEEDGEPRLIHTVRGAGYVMRREP